MIYLSEKKFVFSETVNLQNLLLRTISIKTLILIWILSEPFGKILCYSKYRANFVQTKIFFGEVKRNVKIELFQSYRLTWYKTEQRYFSQSGGFTGKSLGFGHLASQKPTSRIKVSKVLFPIVSKIERKMIKDQIEYRDISWIFTDPS